MTYQIGGLIRQKWDALGGGLGPAISPEFDMDQPGKRQDFENGTILWAPRLGSQFTLSMHRHRRDEIAIEWGPSDPFHYDFWIVRNALSRTWDIPAGDDHAWQQADIPNTASGIGPTHGSYTARHPGAPSGEPDNGFTFWFIVEGCDHPGSAQCNQGWSPMTGVRFFPFAA